MAEIWQIYVLFAVLSYNSCLNCHEKFPLAFVKPYLTNGENKEVN